MKLKGVIIYFVGLFQSFSSQAQSDSQCCQRKIISSPPEYQGTYNFKRVFDGEKVENCVDDCIYSKQGHPGKEYCFKTVTNGAVTIEDQCDAVVGTSAYANYGPGIYLAISANASSESERRRLEVVWYGEVNKSED